MFFEDFKSRYTTIPFAIYNGCFTDKGRKNDNDIIYHRHKEIEIITVVKGTLNAHINNTLFTAFEGDTIIIPPYTLHRFHISKNDYVHYHCICFDLSIIYDNALKEELESGICTIGRIIKNKNIFNYINNTYKIYEKQNSGFELEIAGTLNLTFAIIKNNYISIEKNHISGDSFCMKVIEFTAENYMKDISSKTVAEFLFMNNSYFCRLFKKNFGSTFSDYLIAYRLEKAKELLYETSLSISDVATGTGFNSFSYFGKVFKQKFGITPSQFKKEAIKKQL